MTENPVCDHINTVEVDRDEVFLYLCCTDCDAALMEVRRG